MDTTTRLQAWLRTHGNPTGDTEFSHLCGKFHAHLSFDLAPEEIDACEALCREHRVKLTIIDLENAHGRQQTDVMATCHFRDDAFDAVRRITQQLLDLATTFQQAGLVVTRAKLEHESLPTLRTFTADRYHEVHFKLQIPPATFDTDYDRLKSLGAEHGFVPSRNPRQRIAANITQFVNLRIYDGDAAAADAQVDHVDEILQTNGFSIVETKRETVVFDTDQNSDAWWA